MPLQAALVFLPPAGSLVPLHLMSRSVMDTLDSGFLDVIPKRFIGDNAYNSGALDEILPIELGIEMIWPNCCNRKKRTQDGR